MVKEVSGIISREQVKRLALDDVNAWKDVKSVKIESIEKIHAEDDEYSYWEVNGKYEWNEVKTGSFTLYIDEDGNISIRLSLAYPIPNGRSVPRPIQWLR